MYIQLPKNCYFFSYTLIKSMNEYNQKLLNQIKNNDHYAKYTREKDSSIINMLAENNLSQQSDLISGSKLSNTDASFEMKNCIYELKSIINNKCCEIGRLSKKLIDANNIIEQLKTQLKQKNDQLSRSGIKTKQSYRGYLELRNQLLQYSKHMNQEQVNTNLSDSRDKNESQNKTQVTLKNLIQFHKSAYPQILRLCEQIKQQTLLIDQLKKNEENLKMIYNKQMSELECKLEQKNVIIGRISSKIDSERQTDKNYIGILQKQKQEKSSEIAYLKQQIKTLENQNHHYKLELEKSLMENNQTKHKHYHIQENKQNAQRLKIIENLEQNLASKDYELKQQKEKTMNYINKLQICEIKISALQAQLARKQQQFQTSKNKLHQIQNNYRSVKNELQVLQSTTSQQNKIKDKQIYKLENNLKLLGIADKQEVYKRKLDFLSSEIKNLEKEITILRENNEKISNQLRKAENINQPLIEQKKILEQQLKKYEELFLEKNNQEINNFKQLRQTQSTLQQIKFKLKQLESANKTLQQQKRYSLQIKQTQIQRNSSLNMQCDSLRNRNQELKKMNKQLNKKFEIIENLYKKLEQKYKQDVQNLQFKLENTLDQIQARHSISKNRTVASPAGRFTYYSSNNGHRNFNQNIKNEIINQKSPNKYFHKTIDRKFDEGILSQKKSDLEHPKYKQEESFNIQFITPGQDQKSNQFYSERLPPNYESSNRSQRQNFQRFGHTERIPGVTNFNQRHIRTEQNENTYIEYKNRDSFPFQKIRDYRSSQKIQFKGKSNKQIKYQMGNQLKNKLDDKIQQLKLQNAKLMKKRAQNTLLENYQIHQESQNPHRKAQISRRKNNQTMKDFDNTSQQNNYKNNSSYGLPDRRISNNQIHFHN